MDREPDDDDGEPAPDVASRLIQVAFAAEDEQYGFGWVRGEDHNG